MAKTLELKRRIRSIGKTRQITRTMEMVSTSKLKRATDRVHAARPYAERLTEVIGRLIDPELRERYPLLRQPESVRRAAVILVTSNRGLAGAFNVNLIREARRQIERLRSAGVDVEIHVVGKKAVSFFRYQKEDLAAARTDITDKPTLEDAMSVIEPLREEDWPAVAAIYREGIDGHGRGVAADLRLLLAQAGELALEHAAVAVAQRELGDQLLITVHALATCVEVPEVSLSQPEHRDVRDGAAPGAALDRQVMSDQAPGSTR